MLSKYINVGSKIELELIERTKTSTNEINTRRYYSQVYEILSEDRLEILMPMEKTKLLLLPVDSEYNMVLYGQSSLYQCFARVVDRYKSNNIYILVVELSSNLRKYQRREYYRFSCALEMCSRTLEKEEIQSVEEKAPIDLTPGLPLKRSVIVDISGGGIRFVSSQQYEEGSVIYCSYHLLIHGVRKLYEVVGRV